MLFRYDYMLFELYAYVETSRGSYDLNMCCASSIQKLYDKMMHTLIRKLPLDIQIPCIHICVVIKHQKGGD